MVVSALFAGLSGLGSLSENMRVIADNIANQKTVGYKAKVGQFSTLVTGSGTSSGSYNAGGVSMRAMKAVDLQGNIQSSANDTDLAVNGSGLFVVKSRPDDNGVFAFTRAGSFSQDARGNFVNPAGQFLMGWPLDNEGRLPGVDGNLNSTSSALLGSLEPINMRSVSGSASETTIYRMGMNLDASASVIKGAGQVLKLPQASNSPNSSIANTTVLVPHNTNPGSLAFGDQVIVTADPPGATHRYVYGGVAFSDDVGVTNPYGVNNANESFGAAAGDGNSFRISIPNGVTADFTFKLNGTVNATAGEFNSLATLAEAIDNNSGLTSRVSNGRLYISSKNANDGINFTDNTGTFVADLGLNNIPSSAPGETRFSTIENLAQIMNESEGVVAKSVGNGGIDFHSTLPTGSLSVRGQSGVNTVNQANISDVALDTSKDITITAPGHNLVAGDFVRIEGFQGDNGAAVPDGVYRVNAVAAGQFAISSTTQATGTGPAIAAGTSFTWTRATGQEESALQNLGNPNVETTAAGNLVTIADGGHALDVGDVIYLSGYNPGGPGPGGSELPDGYYRVTAVNAGADFTIEADTVAADNGPAALGHGISYRKVASGNNIPLNTMSVVTTDQSNLVRVYVPRATALYENNDIFTFAGLGVGTQTINNIPFNSTDTHVINNVGNDANGEFIEYIANTNANATGAIANLEGLAINEYTGLFNEFNLSKSKFDFGPAYNAAGGTQGKNLSEGGIQGSWSQAMRFFDSLGVEHDFRVSFAKLDNNFWAVEIHGVANSNGEFDIVSARTDGQIASGTLTFNGDGSLAGVSPELLNPVEIQWKNQSENSRITFDWGTAGVPEGTPGATQIGRKDGMRQVNQSSSVYFLDGNGSQPGRLSRITVDKEGFVIANFDNGAVQRVFKVPLASFTNPNGLAESTGNIYTETNDSGPFNLKEAGSGGVGVISAGSLENSNVNLSDELVNLIVSQRAYEANAKILKAASELLQELGRVA